MKDRIIEKKIEKFNIEEIYTPLAVAKEEVWRRWNDPILRKKVDDFLGGDVLESLKENPKAVLARHVASPNNEFIRFLGLAEDIGLEPVCLEYLQDKFRAENEDKYYLGKFFFCNGVGKKGGMKTNVIKKIDFDEAEGKQFSRIKTVNGEDFINFHHRLLSGAVKNYSNMICDESEWVIKNGKSPSNFYEKFLSMFVCHGVLFENYLLNKNEKDFTNKIVIPTIKRVCDKFGVKPLIVKIYPAESENDLYWRHYPGNIEKLLNKK